MAAILRVKRKKEEEPLDALLISCKRAKVVDEAAAVEEPFTAIVKFAGTVEKPEDCAVEHITKSLSKNYLEANYKQHNIDIAEKIRQKTKQLSNENRFKVVNSKRSVDAALAGPLDEDVVNIIDIEDTKAHPDEKSADGYVYDLYYTQAKEEFQADNLLSILPIAEDELVFEDHYRDEQERDGETSDSNSETNWRNDYPDTDEYKDDDDDSIGEPAIRKALERVGIEEYELSSDDEDFAYGLDEKIVEEYGYKYAKYKARIMKEEQGDSDNDNSLDKYQNYGGDDEDDDDESNSCELSDYGENNDD